MLLQLADIYKEGFKIFTGQKLIYAVVAQRFNHLYSKIEGIMTNYGPLWLCTEYFVGLPQCRMSSARHLRDATLLYNDFDFEGKAMTLILKVSSLHWRDGPK